MLRLIKYGALTAAAGGLSLPVLQQAGVDVSNTSFFRFGRAAKATVIVAADYKRTLRGLDPESDEYWEAKSKVHWRSAERLRDMCCVNGGCFIKVGQHLGALEYLLPPEYVETMKVLHSDAPQSPVESLYQVIREDFGREVDELFSSFEPKPVGAASLAQVHKATLKDGTVVAVKVQHPNVKAHAFGDIATMEVLFHIVSRLFPDFKMMWLAKETKRNLPLELDFIHEARNCERAAKMLSHYEFLKVPKIYWDLTTDRVLTMEFCEGGQINDKDYIKRNNISVSEVSKKLGMMYSEMIFSQGYIHCDPHPGNVFVHQTKKGAEIVLLDHGLYQTLDDDFRLNYCKLWMALLSAKTEKIKKYCQRMGTGDLYRLFACMVTARSWKSVSKGIDKETLTEDEDHEIRTTVANYLPQISDILTRVPRQMLLILKTNDLLRGIETTLETRASASSFLQMSRWCVRAVAWQKRRKCHNWMCRFRVTLRERMSLFMITFYEFYLWVCSSPLAIKFTSQNTSSIGLVKSMIS